MVELVVVIAILFLLVSIMLPHLGKARDMGLRASCIFNLHSTGQALGAFELDHGRFPVSDPLLGELMREGYIQTMSDFRCPADSGAMGDTYSLGFLGGHPAASTEQTALVVCGWHPLHGTLAAFFDHSVGPLASRLGGVSLPVTFSYLGDAAAPGFTFHDQSPLTVASADGSQALVYGKNGAYLVAAAYDPFANDGQGRFSLSLGFDDAHDQGITATTNGAQVELLVRAGNITLKVLYSASATSAKIDFDRLPAMDKLVISNYQSFELTHRLTGETLTREYIPGVTAGTNTQQFMIFANGIQAPGLTPE